MSFEDQGPARYRALLGALAALGIAMGASAQQTDEREAAAERSVDAAQQADRDDDAARDTDRPSQTDIERQARAEAERRAQAEVERRAQADAERRAQADVERRARAEAELQAEAQAERRNQAEAERREVERRTRAEAERLAQELARRANLRREVREARENDESLRAELEQARRDLAEARRNLESAAREVARLSSESIGPAVRDLRRQWLGTGQRAMLGLVILDTEEGAAVSAVSPGGPADEAGIRAGDVIVAIDGESTVAQESPSRVVIRRLSEIDPGTPVELRVASNGESRVLRIGTRERDERVDTFEMPSFARFDRLPGLALFRSSNRWSSMELVPLTPELGEYFGTDSGLLVVRAPEDESSLRDGDVILTIGGREPSAPEHAMRILGTYEPGETLELEIMRARQRRTLEIELEGENPDEDAGQGSDADANEDVDER